MTVAALPSTVQLLYTCGVTFMSQVTWCTWSGCTNTYQCSKL